MSPPVCSPPDAGRLSSGQRSILDMGAGVI